MAITHIHHNQANHITEEAMIENRNIEEVGEITQEVLVIVHVQGIDLVSIMRGEEREYILKNVVEDKKIEVYSTHCQKYYDSKTINPFNNFNQFQNLYK
jgi:hypothetical protein